MPLFEYKCERCGHQEELLVLGREGEEVMCPKCPKALHVYMEKVPSSCSFKIKGLRAANGYGLKSIDTYGKSPVTDKETGCSFTSNRGGTVDHKQGD